MNKLIPSTKQDLSVGSAWFVIFFNPPVGIDVAMVIISALGSAAVVQSDSIKDCALGAALISSDQPAWKSVELFSSSTN